MQRFKACMGKGRYKMYLTKRLAEYETQLKRETLNFQDNVAKKHTSVAYWSKRIDKIQKEMNELN